MLALLIFTGLFLYFLVHQFYLRRRNLPDGPFPLPIIGNTHQFMNYERWEDKFLEWKEKYGNIYTIWTGLTPAVCVNDYDTCVKLFINEADAFSDRPQFAELNRRTRGGLYGVTMMSGPIWQEQRRAAIKILREFGMGKNFMQDKILEEVHFICDGINKGIKVGVEEQCVHKLTDIAVGSVVNSLLCGYRYTAKKNQDEFYQLKIWLNDASNEFFNPITAAIIHYDLLMKMPFLQGRIAKLEKPFLSVLEYIKGQIEDHKKQNDYSDPLFEAKDFIDSYQLEMRKAQKSGEGHFYSEEQCRNVVLDLWMAGQETTSSTMQWAIAYLINHPKVQQKMQEELDRVIGSDRMVNVADKASLPYVNATIMEIQRCVNLLVFNLPHLLAKDVELNGVKVKKGTVVFPQISVIMQDPKVRN